MTRVFVADIIRTACEIYGVTVEEMTGRARGRVYISMPRQRAMYVAREMTGLSYPRIARLFNRLDHTTVMNACRKTTERMAADPDEVAEVEALMRRFRRLAA